jgi:2,3-bisphosphoglycerate-independent phosphoglycerate mutase
MTTEQYIPIHTPHVLIIRDGWGRNPHPEHDAFNAIKLANTPVNDRLMAEWPSTLIATSGEHVGLGDGTMGNSEVGHQNIGAGRIVDQEALRITKACRDGLLSDIPVLTGAIDKAKAEGRSVHLMGICSDAGVHGLLEHLYALLDLCRQRGQSRVIVHLFTDGRDTSPFSGLGYVDAVQKRLHDMRGPGFEPVIGSVIGRYWAMDRDNRWDRTHRAFACLTGRGASGYELPRVSTASEAVQRFYDEPVSPTMKGDEFIPPTLVGGDNADAASRRIAPGDSVIFYNFRGDRPRQLCSAFVLPEFEGKVDPSPEGGMRGFDRGEPMGLNFVMLTRYSEALGRHAQVAFVKPPRMKNIAGEWISSLGLTQFRCAETEKFAHVTFFFNDYRDEPYPGEHREIIQSPTDVKTYDQKPAMSAHGVRDAVLRRLDAADCEPFIVVNFANGDMVGHTGSLKAAIEACEVVDQCVGQIVDKVIALGGTAIVTADHGNAEQMKDPQTGLPHTAHTTYTVPLIVIGKELNGRRLRTGGVLGDVVPTSLEMMGLPQPPEMTGKSLLREQRT